MLLKTQTVARSTSVLIVCKTKGDISAEISARKHEAVQKRQVDLLDETAAAQKAAKTLQVAVAELESDIAGGPCACFSLSTCCTLGGGYMLKGEVRMAHGERNTHESRGGFLLMLLLLSDRSGSSATERSGLDGNM